VGFPWLASFVGWLTVSRVAVEQEWLRTRTAAAWLAWLCIAGVLVPILVAATSRLGGIPVRAGAFCVTALAAVIACGLLLAVLSRDFAAFAFLGGFAVSTVAAGTYAVATSRDLVARQDANDR
jgi:hypothetical protein